METQKEIENLENETLRLSSLVLEMANTMRDNEHNACLALSSLDAEYKAWIKLVTEKYPLSTEDLDQLIGVGNSARRILKDCQERKDEIIKKLGE